MTMPAGALLPVFPYASPNLVVPVTTQPTLFAEMLQDIDYAPDTSPEGLAQLLLNIITWDRERYEHIDRYVFGEHRPPYMPTGADAEYHELARRSITNLIPLVLSTPAQNLYVDGVRSGDEDTEDGSSVSPAWKHWQFSRLDARQSAIYYGALKYGHSFTLTELDRRGRITTKGLSAYNTAAVYEDPANDIDPYAALTITREPNMTSETNRPGHARLWDSRFVYDVLFTYGNDPDSVVVSAGVPHGLDECPVTRFSASVDLEGRTMGVVEPNIPLQDRINQTVLDLLIAQTYGSFVVRTVTGMAPPIKRWTQADIDAGKAPVGTEAGEPVFDADGQPVPAPINLNARRFFFAEDENVKFGTMEATPLGGYIQSLDMSIRHLSVLTQTPPHYLLGEIANLSAEALQAAETALLRKVEEFRKSFGESWERVFRLAAQLASDSAGAQDFAAEVIWRDTAMRSLSAVADGLVKLKELGIPPEGLFHRVPESTRTEIEKWMRQRVKMIADQRARENELIALGGQVQDQNRQNGKL